MATPSRTIRIDDELWTAAQETAVERGESVTTAITRFLIEYTGRQPAIKTSTHQTWRAIQRRQDKER